MSKWTADEVTTQVNPNPGYPVSLSDGDYIFYPFFKCLVPANEVPSFKFQPNPKPEIDLAFNLRKIKGFKISMTSKCNLACTYCYAADAHTRPDEPVLSEDMEEAILNVIRKADLAVEDGEQEKLHINFIPQGETLTIANRLFAFCEKLYATGRVGSMAMTTNLTLINEENVAQIAKYFGQIVASFDGSVVLQNGQRQRLDGSGTFNAAVNGILLLLKHKVFFNLRGTLTVPMVSELDSVADFLDWLQEQEGFDGWIENLRSPRNPNPRIVLNMAAYHSDTDPQGMQDVEKYVEAWKKLKARSVGKRWAVVSDTDLDQNTLFKTRYSGCGTTDPSSSMTFLNNGLITTCHRISTENGTYTDDLIVGQFDPETKEFELDMEKIWKVLNLETACYTECQTCVAKYNCQGGCYVENGSVKTRDFYCGLKRDSLLSAIEARKDLMLETYRKISAPVEVLNGNN